MNKQILETLQQPNPSDYTNTNFKPFVVGNSNPLSDKINTSLLKDIDEAARRANVNVSITTAVSGHRRGSRHETGHAVDIAIVNDKGFGSEDDAEKKGIKDDIKRFVGELQKMGYSKNIESGNDKAVLTFGFPGHSHHVHVSRKSEDGVSQSQEIKVDDKKIKTDVNTTKEKITKDLIDTLDSKKDSFDLGDDEYMDIVKGMLSPFYPVKENHEPLLEELKRIKSLL